MTRGYNFGAGPAMLPTSLLEEIKDELLDWQGTGMSVMEIGHRTSEYTELMQEAEKLLRELLNIPPSYEIFFMGGAARSQFSLIPLNLLQKEDKAGFLISGLWSSMAYEEAKRLKSAYSVFNAESNGFTEIPERQFWQVEDNTKYFYYTPNETINGIRFDSLPKLKAPLIADMTSCLLSEPLNIDDYGLIFAGAQKNIANAGLTLVIMSKDLISQVKDEKLPTMFDYRTFSQHHSMYATPPTFNCYIALKMFQWIKKQGGVEALYQLNIEKAQRLYNYIDSSDFYFAKVKLKYRSIMNVCFNLKKEALLELFLKEAKKQNLLALSGHRMAGGLRASLYNSMPLQAVDQLIEFMTNFARKHQ